MSTHWKPWLWTAAGGALLLAAAGAWLAIRAARPTADASPPFVPPTRTADLATRIGSAGRPVPLPADDGTAGDALPPAVDPSTNTPPERGLKAEAPRLTTMGELYRLLSELKTAQGADLNSNLAALGRQLALEDFDNALRLMRAVSDYHTRLGLARGIFELRGVVNGAEAFRIAMGFNPGDDDGIPNARRSQDRQFFYESMVAALRGWSFTNPAAAAAALSSVPADYAAAAAAVVYGEWGKSDPWAALAAAQTAAPAIRTQVAPAIVRNWAQSDPASAWDYTVRQTEAQFPGRSRLLAAIAATWAEVDVAAALRRVDDTLTDDAEYAEVVEGMAQTLFRKSPENAATLFAAVPGLYQKQPGILVRAIESWTREAPAAAALWAEDAPRGEVRDIAIKGVAAYWAQKDFDAAFAWAGRFGAQVDRAYALSNIALQQGERYPGRDASWILREADDFVRARAVAGYISGAVRRGGDAQVAEALRRHIGGDAIDPLYIETALSRARISEELRASLLDFLGQ
jgi:hypothetical protein